MPATASNASIYFESAQRTRDITSRQGLAFQRRDDTHHVKNIHRLDARDSSDFELPFFEPEGISTSAHLL